MAKLLDLLDQFADSQYAKEKADMEQEKVQSPISPVSARDAADSKLRKLRQFQQERELNKPSSPRQDLEPSPQIPVREPASEEPIMDEDAQMRQAQQLGIMPDQLLKYDFDTRQRIIDNLQRKIRSGLISGR